MPLTLNQFLLLIMTLSIVVAVTVFVILALQIRRTASEAQKTLAEYRELARDLQVLDKMVKEKLEDAGHVLDASRNAAFHFGRAASVFSSVFHRPGSKYWPLLIPVVRFLWRQWKKKKEE